MPTTNPTGAVVHEVERKLRLALFRDDDGNGVIGHAGSHPRWAERKSLTDTELDLRDWGVIFGMCFALLREHDPWEPLPVVAETAAEVAWGLYAEWGSGIAEPSRDGDDGSRREV